MKILICAKRARERLCWGYGANTLSDTTSVNIETEGESVLMLVSSRPALR